MSMGPDPEANFAAALDHIREAAGRGANIVCLPELFRAQYFCQREDTRLFDLAEPIPGPSTAALADVARETRVAIVASLFERRAAGLYHNTAVTLNADGAIASVYRKMHIPDDPLYYEKYYFTPGDLGFKAVDTAVGRIGTLVCWDQWYPEGARLTAMQGAEDPLLSHRHRLAPRREGRVRRGPVRRLADHPARPRHRQRRLRRRRQPRRPRTGRCPRQSRGRQGPGILGRQLPRRSLRPHHRQGRTRQGRDPHRRSRSGAAEDTRRNWPFLRDRRIDAYAPITKALPDPSPEGSRWRCREARDRAPAKPRELGFRMPAEWDRTTPPGSPGPTTAKTGRANSSPSPGSTPKSSATSPASSASTSSSNDAAPEQRATRASCTAPAPISTASTSITGPPTASGSATPAPSSCATLRARSPSPTGSFNAWAKYDDWRKRRPDPRPRRRTPRPSRVATGDRP